jgi:hypothetical protein
VNYIPAKRKKVRSGIRDNDGPIRCQAHLAFIRSHVCSVMNDECEGDIEAAHVRMGTDGGIGLKPSDSFTVPLCRKHHAEQHRGEQTFWQKYKQDPLRIAAALWGLSPAGRRYEMKRKAEQ